MTFSETCTTFSLEAQAKGFERSQAAVALANARAMRFATSEIARASSTLNATRMSRAPIAIAPARACVARIAEIRASSRDAQNARPDLRIVRCARRPDCGRSGVLAASPYKKEGMPQRSQIARALSRASSTACAMVASRSGTNGRTSSAPMRGCTPRCVRKIDAFACYARQARARRRERLVAARPIVRTLRL